MKLNLLNDMARICRLLSLLLLLAVGLAGCKTSRHSSSLSGESACLSSKVQLTVPHKDATLTVNGTMKLKKATLIGMTKRKIIVVPCIVKSWL